MDNYLFGAFGSLTFAWTSVVVAAVLLTAIFLAVPLWGFTLATVALLWLFGAPWWLALIALVPLTALVVAPLRQWLLSDRILGFLRQSGFMPQISETEREAIAAGNVWLDGELFSGRPDLRKLATAAYPDLNDAERELKLAEQGLADLPIARELGGFLVAVARRR